MTPMTRFLLTAALLVGLSLPAHAADNTIILHTGLPETNQALQASFAQACPGIRASPKLTYYPRQVRLSLNADKLTATDGKSTLTANAFHSTEEITRTFNTEVAGKLFWLNVIPWGKKLARVALFNQPATPGATCIRVVPSFFAVLSFVSDTPN